MTTITDKSKVTGKVTLCHFDKDGKLISEQIVDNLVVTTGLNYIASRLVGETPTATEMTHMALGSSSTTPALSDTTLGAQLGRVGLSSSTGIVTNNTVTYIATFGADVATGAVTEAGIFDASTGGNMLCRTTFPVINKGAADSLSATWVITIS